MPVAQTKDFLVVLNDNQMSISRNVGAAISAYPEPDLHRWVLRAPDA